MNNIIKSIKLFHTINKTQISSALDKLCEEYNGNNSNMQTSTDTKICWEKIGGQFFVYFCSL